MTTLAFAIVILISAHLAQCQYHAGTGLPLEPWDLKCEPGQALAGVYTSRALAENEQYDWELSFLCWEVDNQAPVKVEEADCEMKEAFEFTGHVLFGDESVNCGYNQYINALKGEFVEGKRMWCAQKNEDIRRVQLQCCSPQNAEIDEKIGCHSSFPVDIKKIPATGVETPYEHELTCPNWVAVAWETCDSGVKIKYCPFNVEGSDYKSKRCRQIRTTDTVSCPTPYMEPWTVACTPSQTIAGFSSVMLDSYGEKDLSFRFFCRDVDYSGNLEVSDSDCRWTDSPEPHETFTEQRDWEHPVNCQEGEYVSAVKSAYDGGKRTLWFKCCKPQNAVVSRRVGCHSTKETPTYSNVYSECRNVKTTEWEENPECSESVTIEQCPKIPFGECEKQCEKHSDCKERYGDTAFCCNNDCEDVCFYGVPCLIRECIGTSYCPVHCDRECNKRFEQNHVQNQWRRLLGWECRSLLQDDPYEQNCCCFYESSDPNCDDIFNVE